MNLVEYELSSEEESYKEFNKNNDEKLNKNKTINTEDKKNKKNYNDNLKINKNDEKKNEKKYLLNEYDKKKNKEKDIDKIKMKKSNVKPTIKKEDIKCKEKKKNRKHNFELSKGKNENNLFISDSKSDIHNKKEIPISYDKNIDLCKEKKKDDIINISKDEKIIDTISNINTDFFENINLLNIQINENNFDEIFTFKENEYSECLKEKIEELYKLYEMGFTINKNITNSYEYKNPMILEQIMKIFDVNSYSTNYPKNIYNANNFLSLDL